MENIIYESKNKIIEKSAPPKDTSYPQSKEYDTFINTMASVVEKYGAEILKEIDCAV